MKKLVSVQEVEGAGLESLLGEQVWIWCARYIYAGNLVGVNEHDIELNDVFIVYETGGLQDSKFKDAQPLPSGAFFIRTAAIEAYAARKVTLK